MDDSEYSASIEDLNRLSGELEALDKKIKWSKRLFAFSLILSLGVFSYTLVPGVQDSVNNFVHEDTPFTLHSEFERNGEEIVFTSEQLDKLRDRYTRRKEHAWCMSVNDGRVDYLDYPEDQERSHDSVVRSCSILEHEGSLHTHPPQPIWPERLDEFLGTDFHLDSPRMFASSTLLSSADKDSVLGRSCVISGYFEIRDNPTMMDCYKEVDGEWSRYDIVVAD